MSLNRIEIKYPIPITNPIRIAGSNDPPYRLINEDPAGGKVWVSENAGIRAGEGTPVAAGTSLLWTKPVELFAIAETTPSTLILTTNVEDWQPDPTAIAVAILNSGVIVVDNPLEIFSGTFPDSVGPTDWIDVSHYQSLLVAAVCTAATPGGYLSIQFSDDGVGIVRSYRIEFRDATAANNADRWNASIPIVGKFVRPSGPPAAACVIQGSIVASNRLAYAINQEIPTSTAAPAGPAAFYWDGNFTILAGAAEAVLLPPWFGEIEIDVEFTSAAAPVGASPLAVLRFDISTGAYVIFRRVIPTVVIAGSTIYRATINIHADGDALGVTMFNGNAVNFTNVSMRIIPVSGYGAVT